MPTGKPEKMKPCKICGKLFLPATPSTKFCKDDHYTNCPICGKSIIWNTTRKVEPCSKECKKEATRRMNQEKYGCDHPMQNEIVKNRYKQSMMDKYGVEHALQNKTIRDKASKSMKEAQNKKDPCNNLTPVEKRKKTMVERYGAPTTLQSKELKEKVDATNLERYGVDVISKSKSVQDKIKKTNLEKYGAKNPMQNPEIAKKSSEIRYEHIEETTEKIKQTFLEKYGVDNPSKIPEVQQKIQEKLHDQYPQIMEKMQHTMIERYGVPFYVLTDECRQANKTIISKINRAFGAKLEACGVPYKFEHRIKNRSYDIEILNTNILIEIDPMYTHSGSGNHWNPDGISKDYHLYKSLLAEDNGYRCIHIFDWDDQDKIVNTLKPKVKISADSCQIWHLKLDVANEFLDEYDLHGKCRNQLLCLGLVKDGELLQVMTFGKSIYDKNHNIVIRRMATKFGFDVIGGFNKMLHYASEVMELYGIMVYVDIAKCDKTLYENLDMTLLKRNPPRKVWYKDGKYKLDYSNRVYLTKNKTFLESGKSYDEFMFEDGWDYIFDCGQYLFEY